MKPIPFLAPATLVAATVALALAGSGCGSNGASTPTAPPQTGTGQPATLGVATNKQLGKILDDADGDTLYLFAKDTGINSTCTGACASAWPPLRASGQPTVGVGARDSFVSTTRRSDGPPQVTYRGHPLYTYTGDQKPGDTNGQGLTAFGGGWFALSPTGTHATGGGSNGGGPPY
jgi:predicted lipoprotein with Yx(FWY)xxD motif